MNQEFPIRSDVRRRSRHRFRSFSVLGAALLVAATLGASTSFGAADPERVTLEVAGSVDCPDGTVTHDFTVSHTPSDAVATIELGPATAILDGPEGSVTHPLTFTPRTLTSQHPSADASVVAPIGVSVTVRVAYVVTLADGDTEEGNTMVILDAAPPGIVCPEEPESYDHTTTSMSHRDAGPPASLADGTVETAPAARPAPAEPDYTG